MQRVKDIIEKVMIIIVSILGLGVALYLCYYSFRYSYSMDLEYNQQVFEYVDSLLLHMISLAVFLVVLGVVYKITRNRNHMADVTSTWKKYVSLIAVAAVMFLICLLWIFGVKNSPANDQKQLLLMIDEIENGNYDVFLPYGFLGAVQHQIGLVTVFYFLFKVFHSFNYQIIQIVNALCVLLLAYFGGKYIKKLSLETYTEVIYEFLMICCFPIYVYSAFVYGEIISITAGMVMVWLIWHYLQSEKLVLVIPICICAVLGTMTRGNYLVLIIACGIVLGWYTISKKNWKHGVVLLCLIAAPLIQKEIMISSYEHVAGFQIEHGMPKELWIAMGMQENGDVANGWYNGYIYETYNGAGQNSEAASDLAKAYIHDRTMMFKNGTADWKEFYKEKVLSQWNEPTYECFGATDRVDGEKTPFIENLYTGRIHRNIEIFLNQYQFIIYLGFMLYIVFCVIKKAPLVNYLLVIYIIGGLMFSILWEASSRYVFPYFVFMIPCAAYGWTCLMESLWGKRDALMKRVKKS